MVFFVVVRRNFLSYSYINRLAEILPCWGTFYRFRVLVQRIHEDVVEGENPTFFLQALTCSLNHKLSYLVRWDDSVVDYVINVVVVGRMTPPLPYLEVCSGIS